MSGTPASYDMTCGISHTSSGKTPSDVITTWCMDLRSRPFSWRRDRIFLCVLDFPYGLVNAHGKIKAVFDGGTTVATVFSRARKAARPYDCHPFSNSLRDFLLPVESSRSVASRAKIFAFSSTVLSTI